MPKLKEFLFVKIPDSAEAKYAKISGNRLILFISGFAWLVFTAALTFEGFGLDTDAWLMARSASLLRAGEGYDPARSLGNPLWEFLLVIFQPELDFRISNGINLLLALVFLFRLKFWLSGISGGQIGFIQLCLCLIPVFTEAAGSSMELMSGWLLLMEAAWAIRHENRRALFGLALLSSFVRPEFFLFLVLAAWGKKYLLRILIIPGLFLLAYLCFSWGKNPAPFQSLAELPAFYAARGWYLIRQAGLLLPVYLTLLFLSAGSEEGATSRVGKAALFFFVLFPFEWAYAFPALLSGLVFFVKKYRFSFAAGLLLLAGISLSSSLFFTRSGLLALYWQRQLMCSQFRLGETAEPGSPVLLLDGATFLPTRYQIWERSHRNRLFHRKGSNFWVGERFSRAELDSFQREGFRLCRFSGKANPADWLEDLKPGE